MEELTDTIKRAGGILEMEGGEILKCRLPQTVAHLVGELKAHKSDLIALLTTRGGRVAAFPRCPRCSSYALYRKDNVGAYECLTCGLAEIEEITARRSQ